MLLLDTHLVLWSALAPERLSATARRLIELRLQPVAFSDATLWEVAIKSSVGKPGFAVDAAILRKGLLAAGFDELPIRAEHVLAVAGLPWLHRDPFDRLLVAQAAVEGLTLLSVDKQLKRYGKHVRQV
jgi:PIN domain nuclease of toxin-antitoxin system